MRRSLVPIMVIAGVVVGATACSRSDGQVAAGKPPVTVDVAAAKTGQLLDAIDVVGTLSAKFSADVKSEFTAIISEVYVTEWVHVAKGTPLAKLDTSEGEATVKAVRAAWMQATVAETRALRELERAEKARTIGLVTQQNLDDATTARDAAAAVTAAAKAQLDLAETRLAKAIIRAPMDGVVAFRGVSVGDRVENMGGGPMFTVVDTRLLDLQVTVPSTRSSALRVGLPLEFTTDAVPAKTFRGTVKFINPTVDSADRGLRVIAEVPNQDGALRGGLFVKGRILTGSRDAVLQIPRAALLSWDVEHATADVFVIADEVAERRSIKTGATTGESVEIVEGLAAGDKVVTRGGFNLKAGDRVKVATAEGA